MADIYESLSPIPDLVNHFISDMAVVYYLTKRGDFKRIKQRRIRGYWAFTASRAIYGDGKTRTRKVHRCMLLAHKPIKNPDCYMVRHLDDDKNNNSLSNLAWGDASQNYADSLRNGKAYLGLIQDGQRHHMAKLKDDDVIDIRSMLFLGARGSTLADAYGVSRSTISMIKNNISWRKLQNV